MHSHALKVFLLYLFKALNVNIILFLLFLLSGGLYVGMMLLKRHRLFKRPYLSANILSGAAFHKDKLKILFMAHYDSKSQNISPLFRMLLVSVSYASAAVISAAVVLEAFRLLTGPWADALIIIKSGMSVLHEWQFPIY